MRYEVSLAGRNALITGGARGIGAATAIQLAARGATVHISDVLDCSPVEKEILSNGGKATAHSLDVTDAVSCNQVVEDICYSEKKLDILICNAGVCPVGKGINDAEQWQTVMNINLFGAQNCVSAVWDGMTQNTYGRIVLVSSMAFYQGGLIVGPEYSTSKAALIGLSRHLARNGGKDGINVNAVAPGIIDTDMTATFNKPDVETIPVRRYGTAEDVAGPISFLCGPESDYITGSVINVTGGMVLAA
ncbi:MAG: SDR family NAD(P)-dependent oxidoreductase [Pseudomonadota bacterium]